MDKIPSEIIQDILRKFESTNDLKTCSLVCKRWSYLALEILWFKPSFHLRFNNSQPSSAWITFFTIIQATQQTTFSYASFIRRINLSPLSILIEDLHVMTLRACKRLERLTLANCSKLTDVGLCTLIHDIGPSLVSIDLSDVYQITDATIIEAARTCPQLQGFNLSMSRYHHGITDTGITMLAIQCTLLRRIKLNNCSQVSDQSAIALSIHCPRLVEVDFMNCKINNQALISIFNHNQELRELRLSHADNTNVLIDDGAFINSLLQQRQQRFYQQLRLVDFTGISIITDTSIDILILAAPKIRSLVLNKCSQITDQGVLSICKLGRYLHFLHLGHCSQITDLSIQRLASVCPRIRYLDMACCVNITDVSVIESFKHLSKLKRIGLVKCALITDAAIRSLTNQTRASNNIERIHLSYCTRLSVSAVAELLNNCHKLNHLSLTQVPAFLRNDLQQFCRPPPKDFTELQRNVFCVYSDVGVQNLKNYLNTMYFDRHGVEGQ
ncbi:hypothetical protein [Parasitella parasitica]|uniref:F-box domain-containing protein n=1 Tax=Parasitella parasitica TaxID=35722 RepID=A0A0B7NLS1_9FUNG|nr:hypothetical protein [Parasitella parasitica]